MAALGQNFAIFRGQTSNEAYVLDAYCSHLGADLSAGGKVIGEVVQVRKLHTHSIYMYWVYRLEVTFFKLLEMTEKRNIINFT